MRIVLADDHRLFREAVRALLSRWDDLDIVAEAETGAAAVALARAHKPDVVLMDVAMPDMDGIEATRLLREQVPQTRVVALSMCVDANRVNAILKAGATAYVLKDADPRELLSAISAVVAGNRYLSRDLTEDMGAQRAFGRMSMSNLTVREREVLRHLANGERLERIASRLAISVPTVEFHRRRICSKLGFKSVAGLTKYAVREGLAPLDP